MSIMKCPDCGGLGARYPYEQARALTKCGRCDGQGELVETPHYRAPGPVLGSPTNELRWVEIKERIDHTSDGIDGRIVGSTRHRIIRRRVLQQRWEFADPMRYCEWRDVPTV